LPALRGIVLVGAELVEVVVGGEQALKVRRLDGADTWEYLD
jgi:hypothetical protein